jgi:hypothetical protein
MLIEFSVKNFRSILERQTLSMAAASGKELRDSNVVDAPTSSTPALVRSAVIYGPNAAGKSNLLLAMNFMWQFVQTSAQINPGTPLNITPFAFAQAGSGAPTEFELVFAQDSVRYQYGFALTRERIHGEWLYAWPGGRQQRWFERRWKAEEQRTDWYFGPNLTGPKKVWQEATREASLLLSTAVQLNAEALMRPFAWMAQRLKPVFPYARFALDFSLEHCASDPAWKDRLVEYLAAADTGITDMSIEKKTLAPPTRPKEEPSSPPTVQITFGPAEVYDVRFTHRTEDGREAQIGFNDESGGTQKLFAMAGPWIDVLQNGYVLLIDELDTSLHPILMRHLLRMFHDPAINTKGAQLIFTTHDTTVLDADIFRRDQIWFVEKDRSLQSHLYPLTDFSPRKPENIERGYLQGRYGALPFIGELKV